MTSLFKITLAASVMMMSLEVQAQSLSSPPIVRVPLCLQFPETKTLVPCTGVVPVNPSSGNPIPWDAIGKASPSDPTSSQPVINGAPVNNTNPLPVVIVNGTSSTNTPLSAGSHYIGNVRDNGGSITVAQTKFVLQSHFGE